MLDSWIPKTPYQKSPLPASKEKKFDKHQKALYSDTFKTPKAAKRKIIESENTPGSKKGTCYIQKTPNSVTSRSDNGLSPTNENIHPNSFKTPIPSATRSKSILGVGSESVQNALNPCMFIQLLM
jgi:hypothetical protein